VLSVSTERVFHRLAIARDIRLSKAEETRLPRLRIPPSRKNDRTAMFTEQQMLEHSADPLEQSEQRRGNGSGSALLWVTRTLRTRRLLRIRRILRVHYDGKVVISNSSPQP
jgi:hypothetical protein